MSDVHTACVSLLQVDGGVVHDVKPDGQGVSLSNTAQATGQAEKGNTAQATGQAEKDMAST